MRKTIVLELLRAFQGDLDLRVSGPGGREYIAAMAVETLDHAVGLRVSWFDQAVFDAKRYARAVEGVLTAGLPLLRRGVVSELASVVGQQPLFFVDEPAFRRRRKSVLLTSQRSA